MRADVGATTYFSEIAMVQTLDNLRRDGVLDAINYLERIPDKLIPRKRELIDQLQVQAGLTGQPAPEAADITPLLGGTLEAGQAMGTMPGRIQQAFTDAPRTAQRALIRRAQRL